MTRSLTLSPSILVIVLVSILGLTAMTEDIMAMSGALVLVFFILMLWLFTGKKQPSIYQIQTLEAMLDFAPGGMMLLDDTHHIIHVNERAAILFKQDKAQLIGTSIDHFIDGFRDNKEKQQLKAHDIKGKGLMLVVHNRPLRTTIHAYQLLMLFDITDIKKVEKGLMNEKNKADESLKLTNKQLIEANKEIMLEKEHVNLLQDIARDANKAISIHEAMHAVIQHLCEYHEWYFGHAYRVDSSTQILTSQNIWYMTYPTRMRQFRKITEELDCTQANDLPRWVLEKQAICWIEDIATSAEFTRKSVALSVGAKMAIAVPLMIDGKLWGLLEFFSDHKARHKEETLHLLSNAVAMLTRVIERRMYMKAIEKANVQIQEMVDKQNHFIAHIASKIMTPIEAAEQMAKKDYPDIYKKLHPTSLLLQDLLEIANLSIGVTSLTFEKASLIPIIKDAIKQVAKKAKAKGVHIGLKTVLKSMPLRCDKDKINLAITHILENAIYYSNKSGHIKVALSEQPKHNSYKIVITDEGPGIPEGKEELIFDKYSQSSKTKVKNRNSTGLGLALCKEIVHLHHGSIAAQNASKGGAVITIILPKD